MSGAKGVNMNPKIVQAVSEGLDGKTSYNIQKTRWLRF